MSGGSGSTSVSGFSGSTQAADGTTTGERIGRALAPGARRAAASLRGLVHRATVSGGWPPARHRGLPSPYLTLIFTLDEPLTMVAHPDPGQPPGEFGTLLGGLHSTPALIAHDGAQSGIQVALRPLGARTLLGLPGRRARRHRRARGGRARRRLRGTARPGPAAADWPRAVRGPGRDPAQAGGRRGADAPGRGARGRLGLAPAAAAGGAMRVSDLAARRAGAAVT